MAVRRPVWRLVVAGTDRTEAVRPYLSSLSVTDRVGYEADRCTVELAAAAGFSLVDTARWEGAVLEPALGYAGEGARAMGRFGLDTVTYGLVPLTCSLTGRSTFIANAGNRATLRATVPERIGVRTPDRGTTVRALLDDLAAALGMTARMPEEVGSADLGIWQDWTDQRYGDVIAQVAKGQGCYVQVRDDVLHLVPLTASAGTATVALREITRGHVTMRAARQVRRTCVKWANWEEGGMECAGSGEPSVTLDDLVPTREEARMRAAGRAGYVSRRRARATGRAPCSRSRSPDAPTSAPARRSPWARGSPSR